MFDDARGGTIHACVQLFNALWPILSFLVINQFVNYLHKVSYSIAYNCYRSASFVILNPNSSLSTFYIHISHCFIVRKELIIFGRKFINPATVRCHAVVVHSVRPSACCTLVVQSACSTTDGLGRIHSYFYEPESPKLAGSPNFSESSG